MVDWEPTKEEPASNFFDKLAVRTFRGQQAYKRPGRRLHNATKKGERCPWLGALSVAQELPKFLSFCEYKRRSLLSANCISRRDLPQSPVPLFHAPEVSMVWNDPVDDDTSPRKLNVRRFQVACCGVHIPFTLPLASFRVPYELPCPNVLWRFGAILSIPGPRLRSPRDSCKRVLRAPAEAHPHSPSNIAKMAFLPLGSPRKPNIAGSCQACGVLGIAEYRGQCSLNFCGVSTGTSH